MAPDVALMLTARLIDVAPRCTVEQRLVLLRGIAALASLVDTPDAPSAGSPASSVQLNVPSTCPERATDENT